MGNMSYCRFENTASDLADCSEALDRLFTQDNGDEDCQLSERELRHAKHLVKLCYNIIEMVQIAAHVETMEELEDETEIDQAMDEAQLEAKKADREQNESLKEDN